MAGQAGNQGSKARPGNRRVAQWTRGYARLPGIPDEFLDRGRHPARGLDAGFSTLLPN